jgi:hypothetical protein
MSCIALFIGTVLTPNSTSFLHTLTLYHTALCIEDLTDWIFGAHPNQAVNSFRDCILSGLHQDCIRTASGAQTQPKQRGLHRLALLSILKQCDRGGRLGSRLAYDRHSLETVPSALCDVIGAVAEFMVRWLGHGLETVPSVFGWNPQWQR